METEAACVAAVPEGFAVLDAGGPYIAANGPLFFKRAEDGLVLGTRIEDRHCNPIGTCHGGWLASFADMVLPIGARYAEKLETFLITVNLSLDFLGPARAGDWIEGRAQVLQRSRKMVFAQGVITREGAPVLRASAILKILS